MIDVYLWIKFYMIEGGGEVDRADRHLSASPSFSVPYITDHLS